MENIEENPEAHKKGPVPIEHDYDKHQSDPGPAPQAIEEHDNKGAGLAMKWVIPIAIIILVIVYWIMF